MDRWMDGRTVDGWVFGCGRVSRSVNGWMNESLGGWINGLEGELSVWVVRGRMDLHGMGGWLADGLMIAWMKKMSFHLPASHSASLSKIALCTPFFFLYLTLKSPTSPALFHPPSRGSEMPDGSLPRKFSSSLCLCAERSSLCRDLILHSSFSPLLTCLRRQR